MGHSVVAPLVVARDADGRHVYLYQGSPVPAGVPEVEVKRLVDGGFVAEDKPEAAADGDAEDKPAPPKSRAAGKRTAQD